MAFWGPRDFDKNTAKGLDFKQDDTFLEIGFGSGLFIKKYAAHVSRIAGVDYSEDMVRLANAINKKLVQAGKAECIRGQASFCLGKTMCFQRRRPLKLFISGPHGNYH
ncbi:methyltransferase domain-containing protein [candidate division FCPU426 bacterium]|nr:methyltransferase domain-containing protein [candidate division FCPU426 bacterium]